MLCKNSSRDVVREEENAAKIAWQKVQAKLETIILEN